MGERKTKNEYKTRLVNKANRAHMLIKDGIGTLISDLIYSKFQATSGHNQSISLVAASKEDNVKSNGLHEE